MPKVSLYNHFQPWRDGLYIAYNAFTGAIATMTGENYAIYQKLTAKLAQNPLSDLNEEEMELRRQLEYGHFLYPDDRDERESVKFIHSRARYGQSSLALTIAPTMACNMACKYCFEENKTGRMSAETIKALVKFVKKRAPFTEKLFAGWYGGEPLLAMDIIEELGSAFIKLSNEHEMVYSSSMISNGYLLTPENTDRLEQLGVGNIQITIDGPSRLHNEKRPLKNGQPSFDTIIDNMIYASDKMGLSLRINVDKSFRAEIIAELLDEIDAVGLREKVSVHFGKIEASTRACANISETCFNMAEFARITTDFYGLLLDNGFRIDLLPSPTTGACMAQTVSGFLIDSDGDIYRCFNHPGDKEKSMGNISADIDFQHPNFTRMFRFNPCDDQTCSVCNILPICMGGCPSRREDRGITGEELCQTWKHNLEPMLEIIARSKLNEQAKGQIRAEAKGSK
ncbi:MAG: SPASM domain-containing protein [FCB group bacterium]|nr:SPASM domain-containing protein [FCB group bacterium]